MTQYLLSVVHEDGYEAVTEVTPEIQAQFDRVGAFNQELMDQGSWVFAGGLMPPSSATVVRSDGVHVSMTDGPFAESKEVMGGFWVIEASDLDAALEWARKGSAACGQAVEVRPFQQP